MCVRFPSQSRRLGSTGTGMSFLYPEHPMAKEWADFFEKTLEIYGIFYTRPEVKAFESKGGRWVESLGIYNWAFLRPTSATNIALKEFDGKNRFAGKYMATTGTLDAGHYDRSHSIQRKDGKKCYPPQRCSRMWSDRSTLSAYRPAISEYCKHWK